MNWFDILKNAGLRQSQRQGFRLDDKDEDYVLEEENDCFEKLKNYLIDLSKEINDRPFIFKNTKDQLQIGFTKDTKGDLINAWLYLQRRPFLEDSDYCYLLEDLKNEPQLEMIMEYAFKNDFIWRDWAFEHGFYLKASHKDYGRTKADGTKSQYGVIRGPGRYNAKIVHFDNPMEVISFFYQPSGESNNEDTQKSEEVDW